MHTVNLKKCRLMFVRSINLDSIYEAQHDMHRATHVYHTLTES